MTPTISTSRLVLRPLVKATQRQLEWLRDPKVVEFSEQRHRGHTLSSQLKYINSFTGGSHIWAICRTDDDEHIGNLTASHDAPNDVADIGIMIGKTDCWGLGYATEAWKSACSWLLDKDCGAIRKLEAGAMKCNVGMLRVLQKSGFTFECERPGHFMVGEGPVAAMYFGKNR